METCSPESLANQPQHRAAGVVYDPRMFPGLPRATSRANTQFLLERFSRKPSPTAWTLGESFLMNGTQTSKLPKIERKGLAVISFWENIHSGTDGRSFREFGFKKAVRANQNGATVLRSACRPS